MEVFIFENQILEFGAMDVEELIREHVRPQVVCKNGRWELTLS
jgi:hypothetical protein